uniref:CSON003674 protein n=1 Tax=Culicoides sonorensis TaxID=179676 RepID=A0A336LJ01_CULSO
MGNQPGKEQNLKGKYKKNLQWNKSSAGPPLPPSRPELVTNPNIGSDAVTIRWGRPISDGGAPIQGYIVEHRRIGSQQWLRAVNMLIPNNELTISGLDPGWKYHFRVIAQNVVGISEPSEYSEPLTVMLQRNSTTCLPMFSTELEDTAVVENSSVEFKVTYYGIPVPEIIWYKDGFELLNGKHTKIFNDPESGYSTLIIENILPSDEGEINVGRYEIFTSDKSSSLRITNVQRSDRGEYLVKALNKIGEDSKAFLVTVTSKPDPPGKAIITKCVGTSATITFSEPADDGGCKIGNYIIEYNRVGWDVWLKATSCRGLTTTLHDLFEGSEYKFRVKAENPYGVSDPGEESYLLFIPDVKRGILHPIRNNISSPSLNGTRNSSTRSSLLSIPEEKTRLRSLTPENVNRKVDSETSTRPDSSPKQKPKHTISVQFAANIYDDLPNTVKQSTSKQVSVDSIKAPKAVFDASGEPTPATLPSPSPLTSHIMEKICQSSKTETNTDFTEIEKNNQLQQSSSANGNGKIPVIPANKDKNNVEVRIENQDGFDFDIDAASAPPPPLSLSSPELNTIMPFQLPMRPAVSSTELLYEKAMDKFYQAVANEQAQEQDIQLKKLPSMGNDDLERRKSLPEGGKQQLITRMRFNSLQEDKRISLNRRLSAETSGSFVEKMKHSKIFENQPNEFHEDENKNILVDESLNILPAPTISITSPINDYIETSTTDKSLGKQVKIAENVQIVNEEETFSSDYTDSTASSTDSIVAKMASLKEKLARIEIDDDDENKTYHPRSMDLRNLSSPYKSPEHGQAVNVLTKPHPLPDPNFVPKPILKRPTSPSSSNFSSPPSSKPSSPTPPSPTTNVRAFSPPPPKSFGSPLMKPPSPKQIELSSGARQTIEEREHTAKKQKKGLKKFFEKITTSPLSSKEKLDSQEKRSTTKNTEKDNELSQIKSADKLDNYHLPSAIQDIPPIRPQISASNERGRKLLQQRQNSEEENKTVIDHYTTILKNRDTVRTAKDKVPIYLNPEAIKKVHEKAKEEGEDIDLEEEENKPKITQGKRELDLSALTFVRRQRSRDSSLNRTAGASRDSSLPRGSSRDTSITRGAQIRNQSLPRNSRVFSEKRGSHIRDQSLPRGSIRDQFQATIVLSNTLPKEYEPLLSRNSSQNQDNIRDTSERNSPSPTPFSRRILQMPTNDENEEPYHQYSRSETGSQISTRSKTPQELEIEDRVKSNLSYIMDVCLLGFAFYLYIFKDAVFCIPILILLVYRQLGDVVKNNPIFKQKPN